MEQFKKYKTIMCGNKSCHYKDKCVYAHNKTELRRDPDKHPYLPVICTRTDNEHIQNYQMCKFAHNKMELNWHPARFHTRRCKYGVICKYGTKCSFAHTNEQLDAGLARHRE